MSEEPLPTQRDTEKPDPPDTEPDLPKYPNAKEIAGEWAAAVGNMLVDALKPHTKAIDAMRADISLMRGEVRVMRGELSEMRRANDLQDDRLDELERRAEDHERRLAAIEKSLPPEAA